MTIGLLYEVPAAAAGRFAGCRTLEDWYGAVGDLVDPDACPTLDAEDALTDWAECFGDDSPVGLLFAGDLAAPETDSNDPTVRFLGPEGVGRVAAALRQLSPEHVMLRLGPGKSAVWLREPLLRFLDSAGRNGSGVVLMWGG